MVALVPGGLPVTVVTGCGVDSMYGVIVYFVIALPPFGGAVQVTVAFSLPALAVTPVGADGSVGAVGVTSFEGSEGGPELTELDAVTLKV